MNFLLDLKSNFTPTLGYLNPVLINLALDTRLTFIAAGANPSSRPESEKGERYPAIRYGMLSGLCVTKVKVGKQSFPFEVQEISPQ